VLFCYNSFHATAGVCSHTPPEKRGIVSMNTTVSRLEAGKEIRESTPTTPDLGVRPHHLKSAEIHNQSHRLIRETEVLETTGLSRTRLRELIDKKVFPSSIPLAPNSRCVGWVEAEVQSYIQKQICRARCPANGEC